MQLEPLEPRVFLSGVPILHSLPAAPVKLYLDFDGAPASTWNGLNVPATPAYDSDGNATTFSATELVEMTEIWQRVSETFSPFNVDVTTANPGTPTTKQSYQIIIGGDGQWTGHTYGGLSQFGSFFGVNKVPIGYVFTVNLGSPQFIANQISHQIGYSLGGQWQSTYDDAGYQLSLLNFGNDQIAPVLGYTSFAIRGLWWNGPNSVWYVGPDGIPQHNTQDDMAVLSGTSNGFGYRADTVGGTMATATALSGTGTLTASSVIEQVGDADYFSFATIGGASTINVHGAALGQMLDPKFQVFNSAGQQVAISDSVALNESLTITLTAGTYYVAVSGHGWLPCYSQSAGTPLKGDVNGDHFADATDADLIGRMVVGLDPVNMIGDLTGDGTISGADASLAATLGHFKQPYVWNGVTLYYASGKFLGAGADVGQYTLSVERPAPTTIKGDVNGDGVLTIADVTLLSEYVVRLHGWPIPSNIVAIGDLSNNGTLTGFDASLLLTQIQNQQIHASRIKHSKVAAILRPSWRLW